MVSVPPDLEELTERVIGAAIAVHRELGPGLLESVYRNALLIELEDRRLVVEAEQPVPVTYKGRTVGAPLKIDLLVRGAVVVEVKAVERANPVFLAQVITYLKLADCPTGLLINFNTPYVREGIRRVHHPELYVKKKRASPSSVLL